MSLQVILPQEAARNLNCFHQQLSWKIKEENWRLVGAQQPPNPMGKTLLLHLDTKIPGSIPHRGLANANLGGCVIISRKEGGGFIAFITYWPKEMELKNIRLDARITIRLSDGSSVNIKCDRRLEGKLEHYQWLCIEKNRVKLDAELLYDEERCFILEAELKVTQVDINDDEVSKELKVFASDMGSIFDDSKTSDVVVIAGNEKFNCHKIILGARCEVFKNMLAPHTSESENNTIEIKEVCSEAVKTMLKYLYNGEVPEDSEKLTPDLLNLSEMYLLDHLKEACVKSLKENLEVSSCISTFIIADRFNSSENLKEVAMEFIKCKAEEVVETEEWAKLLKTDLAVAQELMKIIVKGIKEKHKCQFCVVSYPK